MGLAVSHVIRHLLDGQIFLKMLVDVVNQAPQFLIFSVEVICIFLDHIAVMVEEVEELKELALEQEFIVGFLPTN